MIRNISAAARKALSEKQSVIQKEAAIERAFDQLDPAKVIAERLSRAKKAKAAADSALEVLRTKQANRSWGKEYNELKNQRQTLQGDIADMNQRKWNTWQRLFGDDPELLQRQRCARKLKEVEEQLSPLEVEAERDAKKLQRHTEYADKLNQRVINLQEHKRDLQMMTRELTDSLPESKAASERKGLRPKDRNVRFDELPEDFPEVMLSLVKEAKDAAEEARDDIQAQMKLEMELRTEDTDALRGIEMALDILPMLVSGTYLMSLERYLKSLHDSRKSAALANQKHLDPMHAQMNTVRVELAKDLMDLVEDSVRRKLHELGLASAVFDRCRMFLLHPTR